METYPRERILSASLILAHNNQDFGPAFSKASPAVRNMGFEICAIPFIHDIALFAVMKFYLAFQDIEKLFTLVLEQFPCLKFRHQDIRLHVFSTLFFHKGLVLISPDGPFIRAARKGPIMAILSSYDDDIGIFGVGICLRKEKVGHIRSQTLGYTGQGGDGRCTIRILYAR